MEWLQQNLLPRTDEDNILDLDGQGDQLVDLVLYAAPELYFIQGKLDSSHGVDKALAFHSAALSVKTWLNGKESSVSPRLAGFVERFRDEHGNFPDFEVRALYITSATFSEIERNRLTSIQKSTPYLEFLDFSDVCRMIHEQNRQDAVGEAPLSFALPALQTPDKRAYIGVVALHSIANFANRAGAALFEANIRNYLKRTSVNKDLANTLTKDPQDFFLFNNGITIVCSSCSVESGGHTLRLQQAQVVNGCQTVSEILSAWKPIRSQGKTLEGHVLVKVVPSGNVELRRRISQKTNRQNAVRSRDFLAMVDEQADLHKTFKRLGYYYEYRRGQSAMLPATEKRKYQGVRELSYLEDPRKNFRRITAFDCQQCFLAAYLDKPGDARERLGAYSPLDPAYANLFEDIESADPMHHLLPFLIHERAGEYNYGPSGSGWRSHARLFLVCAVFRMVWKLVGEATGQLHLKTMTKRDPNTVGAHMYELFKNEQLGERIIQMSDDALDNYNMALKAHLKDDYNERNSWRRDIHRNDKYVGALFEEAIDSRLSSREGRALIKEVCASI